jgi:general L-amino acid transport system permease protein
LPVAFLGLRAVLPNTRWVGVTGWALVAAGVFGLLAGGLGGLVAVRSDQWGGLTLTLVLAVGSTLLAFPLGVLLALARSSQWRTLRLFASSYIELMRSVPLLTVLFAAAVILPLLLPAQTEVPKVLRALAGIALCMAAYIAEAVRSGLNTLPKGQFEAARTVALGYWKTQLLIILPQALKAALPALTTTFLDFFKGTSLVLIIGVFDLMGASRAALADSQWQAFFLELYLAVGLLYFLLSSAVSAGSARLERRLQAGEKR